MLDTIEVAFRPHLHFASAIVVADVFDAHLLNAAQVTCAWTAKYIAIFAFVEFHDVVNEVTKSVAVSAQVFFRHKGLVFFLQLLFFGTVFALQMQ